MTKRKRLAEKRDQIITIKIRNPDIFLLKKPQVTSVHERENKRVKAVRTRITNPLCLNRSWQEFDWFSQVGRTLIVLVLISPEHTINPRIPCVHCETYMLRHASTYNTFEGHVYICVVTFQIHFASKKWSHITHFQTKQLFVGQCSESAWLTAKSAWGNHSPSSKIPDFVDSYWNAWMFLPAKKSQNNGKCDRTLRLSLPDLQ